MIGSEHDVIAETSKSAVETVLIGSEEDVPVKTSKTAAETVLIGSEDDVIAETSKAAADTVLIGSEEEQPSSVQNMSIQLSLDDDNTGLQKLTPSEDVSAEVQVVDSETEGK